MSNHEALRLVGYAFFFIPAAAWHQFLPPLAQLVVSKLETTSTTKFCRAAMNFVAQWVAALGLDSLLGALQACGKSGCFQGVVEVTFIEHSDKLTNVGDGRVNLVAMAHVVCECTEITPQTKVTLLACLTRAVRTVTELGGRFPAGKASQEDDIESDLADTLGYTGAYATSAHGGEPETDVVAGAGDIYKYIAAQLKAWLERDRENAQQIVQASSSDVQQTVNGLCQS